ncbi:MAG TPA: hypothetical protein VH083_26035 [Myxococcales bacterium]|jgi:hypothetical protein|nr:hypothetical protein [Myxococcales bacterium]
MNPSEDAFRAAVSDGGALAAVVVDRETRAVLVGSGEIPNLARLLDLLLQTQPEPARELYVGGRERSLYCSVLGSGKAIILAMPPAASVALGWALVRHLSGTVGA